MIPVNEPLLDGNEKKPGAYRLRLIRPSMGGIFEQLISNKGIVSG